MQNFSLLITEWYRQNKRELPWRSVSDPYTIWLSEIILQQTRVEQGRAYFQKFVDHYPTVIDLANASEQDVLNDWQGLGYYSRARNLHASAKYIRDELNGVFPQTYDEIIKLKGVGKYTAAAIASFAFNEPKAVVDGNVYRFLSRVFNMDTPIDSTKGQKDFQLLADSLISKENPADHNQAMMEIGAMVCTPTQPKCLFCPVSELCEAREKGTYLDLPVKSKKTKVSNRYFHYLIFNESGKTIIEQRTEKGIWQKLYQFPLVETTTKKWTEIPKNCVHVSDEIVHKLSHQHIHAKFYTIDGFPEKLEDRFVTISSEDIQDFPLPRIIDRYLEKHTFDL
ncbi:MAG: A/G-specific adenine glycosylase [bacterium]|nr:A/G-specific adenine glycosylase [bacterium]